MRNILTVARGPLPAANSPSIQPFVGNNLLQETVNEPEPVTNQRAENLACVAFDLITKPIIHRFHFAFLCFRQESMYPLESEEPRWTV